MDKKELDQLFERYLKGDCSPEEVQQVEQLIEAYDNQSTAWENMKEAERKNLLSDLYTEIHQNISSYQKRAFHLRNKFKLYQVAIAASILFCLSIGIYFYQQRNHPLTDFGLSANQIKPGGNRAVLTLADGSTVNLSDTKTGIIIDPAKLTYNDGSKVHFSALGDPSTYTKEITVRTPRGGTYQVILMDGTKVWLNAASSLKFPLAFKGLANRKVQLIGEAYFEVSKDQKHPFIVKSTGQEVEVLGTHFNINSYSDEPYIKTTLLEGSVRVNHNTILKPGMQSVLTNFGISVQHVDPDEAVSWKEGKFMFRSEALSTIMKKIERWYNIEVVFKDNLKDMKLTGTISRFENVSRVLAMLEATGEVHFKAKEGKIMVIK